MRKALSHIMVILAMVIAISACSDKGRIIPMRTMVRIYEDMFMADQWLKDFPDHRTKADTTIFYERIFRKYGYSFKDYDASISYYIDRPDKFSKVFKQVEAELLAQSEVYNGLELASHRADNVNSKSYGFVRKTFDTDSQRWKEDTLLLWPLTIKHSADTVAAGSASVDTLVNILVKEKIDASRRDSVRPDKKPSLRKLPGDQLIADPGKDM